MSSRKVISVILAAGQGQRMGQPKALLQWHDHLFLEWMCTVQFLAGIRDIVVVCHPDLCYFLSQQSYPKALFSKLRTYGYFKDPMFSWLDDIAVQSELSSRVSWLAGDPNEDAYSSLQRAWRYCQADTPAGLLVGPVDQGPYPMSLLRSILNVCANDTQHIGVPSHHGQSGHPVWLGGDLVASFPPHHPNGLRGVIQERQYLVVDIPVDHPAALRNINTPVLLDAFLQNQTPEGLFVFDSPLSQEQR